MLTNVRPPNQEFSWALNDAKRRIRNIRKALDLSPRPDDPRLSAIAGILDRFLKEIEAPLCDFTKDFQMQPSEPVMSSGCDSNNE